MKNLVVDIGNSRVKYAVVCGQTILAERSSDHFSGEEVQRLLADFGDVQWAILASTRGDGKRECAALEELGVRCRCFDASCAVPLANDYRTPQTLGRDRLAAAVGADTRYPGRSMLIVDFGTAITCDLVTDHTFRGGFITPGLRLRLRALHDYTGCLPLVEPAEAWLELGLTTDEAIAQGVAQGIVGEIQAHIDHFGKKIDDLLIIFTGGDAKHFVKQIKNTIFADCDLVLLGLNRILTYDVQTQK